MSYDFDSLKTVFTLLAKKQDTNGGNSVGESSSPLENNGDDTKASEDGP